MLIYTILVYFVEECLINSVINDLNDKWLVGKNQNLQNIFVVAVIYNIHHIEGNSQVFRTCDSNDHVNLDIGHNS